MQFSKQEGLNERFGFSKFAFYLTAFVSDFGLRVWDFEFAWPRFV